MDQQLFSVGQPDVFRHLDGITDTLLARRGITRRDAATDLGAGAYFQRELERIYPGVIRAKREPLNAYRLFFVDRSVPQGAETFTHRLLEHVGEASVISNWADDLPQVGIGRSEFTSKFKSIGDSFGYSEQAIAAAAFAGMPLSTELPFAARRAIDEKLNTIAWHGLPDHGIYGVLTFPYIPRYVTSAVITAATDTAIENLHAAVARVLENSSEVEKPNRLILAPRSMRVLSRKLRTNTDSTALKIFLENDPNIKTIESAQELTGIGPNGEDGFIVDRTGQGGQSEPLNGKIILSQAFTPLPVQRKGLMYNTDCLARTAGFDSAFPLSMLVGYWLAA